MCHKFVKHGSCRFGRNCKYAHIAKGARNSSDSDKDNKFWTEHEKACKLLGLDPNCTFLTEKMVTVMYRLRALAIHPDKDNDVASHQKTIALNNAREYLLKYIGNSHSGSTASSPSENIVVFVEKATMRENEEEGESEAEVAHESSLVTCPRVLADIRKIMDGSMRGATDPFLPQGRASKRARLK